MMRKLLFITILVFQLSFISFAQTQDANDPLSTVNKLFTEMANHNPAGILEIFTKEGILTAVVKNKDGKSRIVNLTGEVFSKNFSEKKSELKEDMYAPKVEIFGDLALVYGRYVFFSDNKISHCGVNVFHLVKTDSGWKIAGGSTTIDPTSCTDEEKARKP